MPTSRLSRLAALLVMAALALAAKARGAAQEPPSGSEEPLALPPVVVIGTTPLPALGIPIQKYAGNVQSIGAEDIEKQNLLTMPDTLYRNLGSVNLSNLQGNPWQADLTYRGFLASPLAGSAIGLSMYLDGMRFNNGFGDTINWDLIPEAAIADIDVIPGSNPIYGLNTLGGALAVRTKRGFDFPGARLEAYGGSFGRWAVEAEYGGFHGPLDWFLTINALSEDGWRDHSPSDVRQLFAKVGWKREGTDLELNYIHANNDLVGNGLAPQSLLAEDRRAVYTFPDDTNNLMHLVNARGRQWLTDGLLLSGDAFYRYYKSTTQNGDAEVNCVDDVTGEVVFNASGQILPLGLCQGSAVGFFDQAGQPLTGSLEREAEAEARATKTVTQDWGATLQLSHTGSILGRKNQVAVGVAYDGHSSRFTQSEGSAAFVPDGLSTGVQSAGPQETEVDVRTQQENIGLYLTDTFDLTERLALTLGGRYQRANITIRDLTGENPVLDGNHTFERFSPSAGLTFRALSHLTLFGSYSEGFRVPTPAELTCADPADPCNLPNAFVADPPLEPVTARTYEVGARGEWPVGDGLQWSVSFFRTDVQDDILFTVVETGGGGFFQNIAATRRQGVEVALRGGWKRRLTYYLNYAYVDATYQTNVTLASVTEPGGVPVKPGDRIPGIPLHNLKFGGAVEVLTNLWIGGDVIAVSGSYLRGDDGNQQAPVPGYTILNLQVRYTPFKFLELWGRVDNATNANYATAGALNWNAFADPIAVQRFLAPGAPIGGWAGVKVRF
jgi:outer membrane receptor protein involved in Fe transport